MTMFRISRTVAALAFAALLSPAQAGVESPDLAAAAYMDAVAKGDAAAVAALYAESAIVLAPDGAVLNGRAAIETSNARNFSAGAANIRIDDVKYDFGDTKGTMFWSWTLTLAADSAAPVVVRGRSLMGWSKNEAGWEISADMFQVAP